MAQTSQPSFETIIKNGNQFLSVEYLANHMEKHGGTPERSHIHDYTEILWIIRGSGKLHLDMQIFELEACNMYFINPGEVHRFSPEGEATGYVLSLSKKILENLITGAGAAFNSEFVASLLEQRRIYIDQNYLSDMKDITERMIKEVGNTREYSNEIILRYFGIFLFYLGKQLSDFKTITQSRNNYVSKQFKDLVEKHYKTKKMVSDYAAELNLTPNYLNEIIKKVTGHSAGHLIRQRIALEAKRYAMHSGVCMKEIGYYLGFSDMAHFSKFFKAVVGSNFTHYKKLVHPGEIASLHS